MPLVSDHQAMPESPQTNTANQFLLIIQTGGYPNDKPMAMQSQSMARSQTLPKTSCVEMVHRRRFNYLAVFQTNFWNFNGFRTVVTKTRNEMERNGLFHPVLFRILLPEAIQ